MTHVGIIGGGQLGRMLALAGYPLDIVSTVLDPAKDACAAEVAPCLTGAYDDPEQLEALASACDVVTYEFENVPVEAARLVARRVPVFPPPAALETTQDRLAEKSLFDLVGLPTAEYRAVESLAGLESALLSIGAPAVLKTRRLGYDGKGQAVVRDALLAEDAWRSVGEVPSILESFVGFDRELSLVAARAGDGQTVFYPLVENHHRDGILRLTKAPAPDLTDELQSAAEGYVGAMLSQLGYVGVLTVEMFQVGDSLMGNEIAPRVHNSGHWTIEGAETSQFENHMRAICGLPLGSTEPRGLCAMVNLIGSVPDAGAVAAIEGAHLHDYGKSARPGRKVGHITIRTDEQSALQDALSRVQELVKGSEQG